MHVPVLLQEVLEYLDPRPGEFILDGTVDGGGHARAIADRIGKTGSLLGLDWDEELIAQAKERLRDAPARIQLIYSNYREARRILAENKLGRADGILIDLGFSSEQLLSGHGFSFNTDEPLRMTYDPEAEPVAAILGRLREEELADVLFRLGGERYSRRIARAIKQSGRIMTTGRLAEVIRQAVPAAYRRGRIDPATRSFQALRIYANKELENLTSLLGDLTEILSPGGRAVVISFHSLEDRLVKEAFRSLARSGQAELLTKKPVTAGREELDQNPRSRSAKLRALQLSQK